MLAILLGASLLAAAPQPRAEAIRLLGATVAGEPDVVTVQRAAEARAAPAREEAESWRRRSRIAGALPKIVAEYRRDDRSVRAAGVSSGEEIDYLRIMPGDTVSVRLEWSLDGVVFGRSELAAAAAMERSAARRATAAEAATKLYFERLRLRLAIEASPPDEARARAEAELELASVTARLHALTGLYEEAIR